MFKKPTVFSDESGSQVLGKDGSIKASFSVADHGASHEGAAVSHLQQNFDNYMAEAENKQYIEITHLLGHKSRVPVHPTMAYKALNRYRNDPSTKSARIVSEEVEQVDEANYSHRAYASHGLMHPDMAKDMNKNDDVDYYLPGTGDKHYGTVTKNDGASVHIRAYNKSGKNANGPLHKFKVTPHLPTNEEVEQFDEISSDMAHRFLKGKRERDYDISPDGKSSKLKKPQSFAQMNKDMKSTSRALRTIERAKKTNEEVEVTIKKQSSDEPNVSKRHTTYDVYHDGKYHKTFNDINDAMDHKEKMQKESKESHEYDYEGEMVHNQLQQMLHHIAELKGMVKPNTNLPEWVQSKITLACDYIQTASDYLSGEMKEENGMPFKGPYRKVGERKDEYGNTVKNVAKHLAKKAMDKQTNEEAELEEKRGLWDNIHAKRKRIKKGSGERMRKPGSEGAPSAADLKASQTEAVDNPYAVGMAAAMKSTGDTPPLEKSTITKAHKIAKKVMKENKFLTGVLNKLEEGRGRPAKPPKEGQKPSAAWLRQQAATAAGKPKEEPVALGMQLRKAKSIDAHVEFDDGKKHKIHPPHIDAFNDHMDSLRTPQEKFHFQKKASASHVAFVKTVTAPLPKKQDHGDHGFPKYRH